MATDPSPPRAYRAACPNCGAPVEFRSAASAFAVCSFCNSTLLRDGAALRRIGRSAELFDDHSPLRLGVSGTYLGAAFTLVGRLQYRYAEGTWNEWHALFEGGAGDAGTQKSGWLSEDNGRYVFAFEVPLEGAAPAAASLKVGAPTRVSGQAWSVASVSGASVIAAQGELPEPPMLERSFVVADLRNPRGEVGTLDYSAPGAPRWSIGASVALGELALSGLAESAEKTLAARGVACPSCGAALEVKLATTQAIVCHQCHAVVDVSQGVGGELRHFAQRNGMEPLIPLGSVGKLALGSAQVLAWQVVGYVERCEVADAADADGDAADEQTFWREYLLYHRTAGFAFLVDAQDGWSWAAPITGVPQTFGESVRHDGVLYRKLYDYTGQVTYVLGEFYWQVTQDQRTFNTDYQGTGAASRKRLNREQTSGPAADGQVQQEVVWSAGETLDADAVMQAFRLAPGQAAALRRDALPTSSSGASLLARVFFWGFVVVLGLLLFRGCGGGDDCDATRSTYGASSTEYQRCLSGQRSSGGGWRTGGGSFGGYSSGGGHK